MSAINEYSATWFEVFLEPAAAAESTREVNFLRHFLPLPAHRRVLDLCCGEGRHCELLSKAGYDMVGLDRCEAALAKARRRCPDAAFVQRDMREAGGVGGSFDATVCLWQSFGYFDDKTNADILAQIHSLIVPDGKLILDVYNAQFFRSREGTRSFVKAGRTITESKSLAGNRLTVNLDYGAGMASDRFEWRLCEPDELCDLAGRLGFGTVAVCSGFDESASPSGGSPRMQLVFRRTS